VDVDPRQNWTLTPPTGMRFGVFSTTVALFFSLEMGDKTQIATTVSTGGPL
jgi:putative Ca2+/H+ antiporter (TMEM165/GDT1 family)